MAESHTPRRRQQILDEARALLVAISLERVSSGHPPDLAPDVALVIFEAADWMQADIEYLLGELRDAEARTASQEGTINVLLAAIQTTAPDDTALWRYQQYLERRIVVYQRENDMIRSEVQRLEAQLDGRDIVIARQAEQLARAAPFTTAAVRKVARNNVEAYVASLGPPPPQVRPEEFQVCVAAMRGFHPEIAAQLLREFVERILLATTEVYRTLAALHIEVFTPGHQFIGLLPLLDQVERAVDAQTPRERPIVLANLAGLRCYRAIYELLHSTEEVTIDSSPVRLQGVALLEYRVGQRVGPAVRA